MPGAELRKISSLEIKTFARTLGFDLTGIAPVETTPESLFYSDWLARGYAGEMHYLERQSAARLNPSALLPGVRSVIVCALNYNTGYPRTAANRLRTWVSRYAWGEDYHETLGRKLDELARWIREKSPSQTRAYVDTGPVNERVFAKYAGVGWFGKNTCIINERIGSWLFLGCVLTDLELEVDAPPPDRCGTCTRCIDACPTQAILEPYVLDSRKCISYTTIELRGEIPESEREGIGHHLYGCDICQDVCPWNRRAAVSVVADFQPREGLFWPEIDALMNMDEAAWGRMIRGTAMRRAKVKGLLRNLMVVAGNSGVRDFASKIEKFLEHSDASVRSHARWALEKLKGTDKNELEVKGKVPSSAEEGWMRD